MVTEGHPRAELFALVAEQLVFLGAAAALGGRRMLLFGLPLVIPGVLTLAAGPIGVPLSLEWPIVIGSLAAAGLSGVIAGWFPARRAASLDIVNALRHE